MSGYVLCPVTITSPAPSAGARMLGLGPDMVCGMRCQVMRSSPGPMMFRCPAGHEFLAVGSDVLEEES